MTCVNSEGDDEDNDGEDEDRADEEACGVNLGIAPRKEPLTVLSPAPAPTPTKSHVDVYNATSTTNETMHIHVGHGGDDELPAHAEHGHVECTIPQVDGHCELPALGCHTRSLHEASTFDSRR